MHDRAHGLALPSLVLLGGVVKPARTEAPQSGVPADRPQSEYRRIVRSRRASGRDTLRSKSWPRSRTSCSTPSGSGSGPKPRSPARSAPPGHIPASLKRLRTGGLVHRWNDLVTATRSAVRSHDRDKAVLESLLVRASDGQRPISEDELCEASAPRRHSRSSPSPTRLINRLDPAGPHRTPRRPSHRL